MSSFLKTLGAVEVREFDVSTKNSALAAEALGCTIGEIAKSVVFRGERTFVVVLSGDKRVDSRKLAALVGSRVELATPEAVRSSTGYTIGGVPPFPHDKGVTVLADRSLSRFPAVWAAGGAPNVVFRMKTELLLRTIGTELADIST